MAEMDFYIPQVNYVVHRPCNSMWRMHTVCYEDKYVAVVALNGSAVFTLCDEELCVKKNDVVIFPPGTARSGRASEDSPWEFVSIIFNLECDEISREVFSETYLHFHDTNAELRNKFVEVAHEWSERKPCYRVKCKYLVMNILYDLVCSNLLHSGHLHQHKLEEVYRFIQENLLNEINIRELAEHIGLSSSYFRKLFKERYGEAPMQYITKLRIEKARDLLASGEFNVTEAAYMSGFNDIYYFSTVFKKETGFPPSKLLRGDKPVNT